MNAAAVAARDQRELGAETGLVDVVIQLCGTVLSSRAAGGRTSLTNATAVVASSSGRRRARCWPRCHE